MEHKEYPTNDVDAKPAQRPDFYDDPKPAAHQITRRNGPLSRRTLKHQDDISMNRLQVRDASITKMMGLPSKKYSSAKQPVVLHKMASPKGHLETPIGVHSYVPSQRSITTFLQGIDKFIDDPCRFPLDDWNFLEEARCLASGYPGFMRVIQTDSIQCIQCVISSSGDRCIIVKDRSPASYQHFWQSFSSVETLITSDAWKDLFPCQTLPYTKDSLIPYVQNLLLCRIYKWQAFFLKSTADSWPQISTFMSSTHCQLAKLPELINYALLILAPDVNAESPSETDMKRCSKCDKRLPFSCFSSFLKGGKTYYKSACKPCRRYHP